MTPEQQSKLDHALMLLTDFLVDASDESFEDIPQVNIARSLLKEAIGK